MTNEELCERLRKVESSNASYTADITTNWHRNPDGPAAAARIEELATNINLKVDWIKATINDMVAKDEVIDRLKAQLAIAQEALRFYRDEWEQDWDDPFPMPSEEMAEDEGDRARQALANMEADNE